MLISEFISQYRNHPVLFIGTGISIRYLENAYTWDGLLKHVASELKGNHEFYLDLKAKHEKDGKYDFTKIAGDLEKEFNDQLMTDRYGHFKNINDLFYERMEHDINCSRFKLYLSELLKSSPINSDKKSELADFKKTRKNIASIITTNYDSLIEETFEFKALIGNDILLSNPYGAVYKIHGCINHPTKIIITEDDYNKFENKYELIRAQLLSIFIHNPIIFLGYQIGDENIKSLLKTIFTYVDPNSLEATKIRDNFLLVEFEKNSNSLEVVEHDIDLEGFSTIRINKIKTDNFSEIYKSLANLTLPVSAMDIRKVQNIVKEIYAGGDIKVSITEDLDSIKNSDKIIAIGSSKTISYQYQTSAEMMANYFSIMDESNSQLLELINKHRIQSGQYFPIYGFSSICDKIECENKLKKQQKGKIETALRSVKPQCKTKHTTIESIYQDQNITSSNRSNAILWLSDSGDLPLEELEAYLRKYPDKNSTDYRKTLCAFDLIKYQ